MPQGAPSFLLHTNRYNRSCCSEELCMSSMQMLSPSCRLLQLIHSLNELYRPNASSALHIACTRYSQTVKLDFLWVQLVAMTHDKIAKL